MTRSSLISLVATLAIAANSLSVSAQGCYPASALSGYVSNAGVVLSWAYTPSQTSFMYDFEDGTLDPWTLIDADGDSHMWEISELGDNGHESATCAMSASYLNSYGALHPDNYLVSPMTLLNDQSVLSFWVAAQSAPYPNEHYGVAISTAGNTNPADFTTIWEETLTAKGLRGESQQRGTTEQGQYYHRTVDLSAYAGMPVYIAFRHFNCTDQFFICLDDIELSGRSNRDIECFNIYRSSDGTSYERIAQVPADDMTYYEYTDQPDFGLWHYQVTALYDNGGETCESDPVTTLIDASCIAPTDLQCSDQVDFIDLQWNYFVEGDQFYYDFDDGSFGPWTQIDADGDGHIWEMSLIENTGHNQSPHYVTSASYSNTYGAIAPDNYLVSPRVKIGYGATLGFWVAPQDASYPLEHYGVAISTTNNMDPEAFTTIWEETVHDREQGSWRYREVDLGAYFGREVYIAFRHFNCYNEYMLDLDDVTLDNGRANRLPHHFNVYRGTSLDAMELIDQVPFHTYGAYPYTDRAEYGTYYYRVTACHSWGEYECESEPAHALEIPENDYVSLTYLAVDEKEGGIGVYPNPANGHFTVSGAFKLEIYNTLGQKVDERDVDGPTDITLPAGIYLLKVGDRAERVVVW